MTRPPSQVGLTIRSGTRRQVAVAAEVAAAGGREEAVGGGAGDAIDEGLADAVLAVLEGDDDVEEAVAVDVGDGGDRHGAAVGEGERVALVAGGVEDDEAAA